MKPKARIYRMVMDKHICPYGQRSVYLLKKQGFEVEDNHLTSREETDAFKVKHDVKTTPQTFIEGERIGGYDDLKDYFGLTSTEETTYVPVIAIFAMSFLMALSVMLMTGSDIVSIRLPELFIAFAMCTLAIQKLTDLEGFSLQFLNYDLLAQK